MLRSFYCITQKTARNDLLLSFRAILAVHGKELLQHFHGHSLAGEALRGVAMGRVIQHIPQHQNFAYIEECCLDGDAAGVQRTFLCAAEKDDICEQCAGESS